MQSLRNVPRGASANHRGSTSHRLLSTGRLQSALLKRSFSSGSARSYVGSSVPEAGSDGGEVINFARASYYVPSPSTHTGTGEDVPHAGHVPATSSSSAMSAGTASGGNNRLARRKALVAEKKYLATRKEAKLNGGVDRYPGAYTFAELDARSDEAIDMVKRREVKRMQIINLQMNPLQHYTRLLKNRNASLLFKLHPYNEVMHWIWWRERG